MPIRVFNLDRQSGILLDPAKAIRAGQGPVWEVDVGGAGGAIAAWLDRHDEHGQRIQS